MRVLSNRVYRSIALRKSLFLMSLFSFYASGLAAQALPAKIDCSDVTINYQDDLELTDAERLVAMEQAFLESVNRFDLCNLSNANSEQASEGSGQDLAAGGTIAEGTEGLGEESGEDLAAGEAVANTMLEGTEEEAEPEPTPTFAEQPSSITEVLEQSNRRVVQNYQTTRSGVQKDNGKVPEDIPSSDNDDVVAAQIRLAATIEKDADKRRKLWNEYRRYQGLKEEQEIKEDQEIKEGTE